MQLLLKKTKNILYKIQRTYCNENNGKLKPPWRVLFFGSDQFSVYSLKALTEEYRKGVLINDLQVVTNIKGKLNSVKLYSDKEKLKLHKWPTKFPKNRFDVGLVVSFGYLITEDVIQSFQFGMVNVHASLLPRWRGAAPIIYSLAKGDTKTGITIMKIKPKKFDVGEIVFQAETDIPFDMKLPELHETLGRLGAQYLIKTLENLPENIENAKPQPSYGITYAPKIDSSFSIINWNEMTSIEIYNLNRSLTNLIDLKTNWQGKGVKLKNIYLDSIENQNGPGYIEYIKKDKALKVACIDHKSIMIKELSIEGKKTINAQDFNNGYLEKVSIRLRYFK